MDSVRYTESPANGRRCSVGLASGKDDRHKANTITEQRVLWFIFDHNFPCILDF